MSKKNKGNQPTGMQQSVLHQLRLEMDRADEYCQQIIQPVNQHFTEKWDPNCMAPKAEQVTFALSRNGGNITLKARAIIQFDGWKKCYVGKVSKPFAWDQSRTAEELEKQIRAILPQLLQCAGGQMTAGLPSEKTIQLWTSRKTPGKVLMVLVHQIYRVEEGRPAEKQRQLEVLDSLNTTEMAVLRYVTQKGETSISAAASALADQVCTTKAYNGACLERLKK